MKNSRLLVKALLAIFVGLPFTAGIGFLAVVVLFSGAASIMEAPGVRNIGAGVVVIIWAGAGVLGLIGFWLWIFIPRAAGVVRRRITAALIFSGIASVSVLALSGEAALGTLAVIGMVVGGVLIAWLLKPDLRGNPDAPLPAPGL